MEAYSHKRPGDRPRSDAGTLNSIYMSYHWAKECGKDLWAARNGWYPPRNDSTTLVDWSAYHTFGVEWSPNEIVWYVDGKPRYSRRAGDPASLFVPQWPMYMIINTALNRWADPALDKGLPVYYRVDRVTFCERRQ